MITADNFEWVQVTKGEIKQWLKDYQVGLVNVPDIVINNLKYAYLVKWFRHWFLTSDYVYFMKNPPTIEYTLSNEFDENLFQDLPIEIHEKVKRGYLL